VPHAWFDPSFPSGTLKSDEQQSTVAERPLLPRPLASCPEDHYHWKLELAPYRCSVPHSPSLAEGVAGTIARMLRRSTSRLPPRQVPRKLLLPVYRKQTLPAHLADARLPFHSTESRQCAEPPNDINHASRGQAPASNFLSPSLFGPMARIEAGQLRQLREIGAMADCVGGDEHVQSSWSCGGCYLRPMFAASTLRSKEIASAV
jgi:hypothetical protein